MKTKLLIDQHIHGAFGINYNTATVDEVLHLSKELLNHGIGGIFPTLVTDTVENIKRQTAVIKEAANKQTSDMAQILGIHLEGIFINPLKKGIHDEKLFLSPTVQNLALIKDDFIRIITLAPELISPRPSRERAELVSELRSELSNSGEEVKFQAGHCVGADLTGIDGVTHIFNAMEGISHRKESTALSALINDEIYAEVIADGVHLSDDILKLIFKSKPADKILLISDSLPITGYKSACKIVEAPFAGDKIFYDGKSATSASGTIAGSTSLLPDIIKLLAQKNLFNQQFIENPYNYHKINLKGEIQWDEEFNIVKVTT